jgi:HPt (histidine-containing phosphotransfer) domain-containing protein
MTETISIEQLANVAHTLSNELDMGDVKDVAKLCEQYAQTEKAIEQADQLKKELTDMKEKLSYELIPQAMQELGLQTLQLKTGEKIQIKPLLRVTPKVEDRPVVYQWLRDNGFGDLVKNIISASFGRGEDVKAEDFKKEVEKLGLMPKQEEKVEPSTLRAFVNEQVVEKGRDDLPLDKFGAFIGQQTKITKG